MHPLDLTDADSVAALPAQVHERHGAVDGVLNVAGIVQPFVRVADLELAAMQKVVQVNFWGQVFMVKAFLPELLTRPEAAIVNVSSMGGFLPVPGQTLYGASKASVKLFSEGLHAELCGTNVKVTVVFPGAIATNITGNSGVTTPSMGGSTAKPPPMTSPRDAAATIIRALEKGSYRVLVGRDAQLLDALTRVVPERAMTLIADRMGNLLSGPA